MENSKYKDNVSHVRLNWRRIYYLEMYKMTWEQKLHVSDLNCYDTFELLNILFSVWIVLRVKYYIFPRLFILTRTFQFFVLLTFILRIILLGLILIILSHLLRTYYNNIANILPLFFNIVSISPLLFLLF